MQSSSKKIHVRAGKTATTTLHEPSSAPNPPPTGPTQRDVTTRLMTQQGLAIGMASSVLQSQLWLLVDSIDGNVGSCQALDGGGSAKLVSETAGASGQQNVLHVMYFDANCTMPYITADAVVTTTGGGNYSVAATSTYTQADGTILGSLTTNATATQQGNTIYLKGLGKFTSTVPGAQPVSLGLTCDVPQGSGQETFPCAGGIAQWFPDLGESLGSVTPLTLTLTPTAGNSYSATFVSSQSAQLETSAATSPQVTLDNTGALALQGTWTPHDSDSVNGQAAQFSLFPKMTTKWSAASDSAANEAFAIQLMDDTTRTLKGVVSSTSSSSPALYAGFSLDQSGTGTIRYAGSSSSHPIVSWLLIG